MIRTVRYGTRYFDVCKLDFYIVEFFAFIQNLYPKKCPIRDLKRHFQISKINPFSVLLNIPVVSN